MKHSRLLSIAVFAALALTACKKDDDDNPSNNSPSSVAAKLTDNGTRQWVNTDIRVGGVSVFGLVPDCTKDDYWQFKLVDKDYEQNEGPTKCNPNDDQIIESGKWSLNGTNDSLTLYTDQDTTSFKIESISNTNMTLSGDFQNNPAEADFVVR